MRLLGEVARDLCYSTQVQTPPVRGSGRARDRSTGCIFAWGYFWVTKRRANECIPGDGEIFLGGIGSPSNVCCSIQIGGGQGKNGMFCKTARLQSTI